MALVFMVAVMPQQLKAQFPERIATSKDSTVLPGRCRTSGRFIRKPPATTVRLNPGRDQLRFFVISRHCSGDIIGMARAVG